MNTYKTAEVAAIIGIHPNTVRLYEKLKWIPEPKRLPNGYRIFTEFHIAQCKLIRLALQVELLQNGLRKKMAQMIMASATKDFDTAIALTQDYLNQIGLERQNAEEAIEIVNRLLSDSIKENTSWLKRKDVSRLLAISMDTLRNWEMNGLLTVKRKRNGYRVYTDQDIQRLKVIRALRCANYSLEAILRLLQELSQNPDTDIRAVLNTPKQTASIISVCDRLIVSLSAAEKNAAVLSDMLHNMKAQFS